MPSLKESYRKGDNNPFGAKVPYDLLNQAFPDSYVETVYRNFSKHFSSMEATGGLNYHSTYFLLTKNLVLTPTELNDMVSYVSLGNSLFISADYVDPRLLKSFLITVSRKGEIDAEKKGSFQDTHLSVQDKDSSGSLNYGFYYFPFLNKITSFDKDDVEILGYNQKGEPDFIVFHYKRGELFIHMAPRAFTNYFALTNNNASYLAKVFSRLPRSNEIIYWDEFYKNLTTEQNKQRINQEDVDDADFSSFSVINNHPPLSWAFFIVVAGLLLFMFINLKRRQRPIPVIDRPGNATIEYTETIGRLYLQNKNNRRIADKMITYFFEGIRNKYFISKSPQDKDYLSILAGKSGVSPEEVKTLFNTIQKVQQASKVSDESLMDLNSRLESFNQKNHDRRK